MLAEAKQCFANERDTFDKTLAARHTAMVAEVAKLEMKQCVALQAAEEHSAAALQAAEAHSTTVQRRLAGAFAAARRLAAAEAEEREAQMCELQARFDARESRAEDVEQILGQAEEIRRTKQKLLEREFALQQVRLELNNRDENDRLFAKGPRPCPDDGSAKGSGVGSKSLQHMRAASVGLRQQEPQVLSPVAADDSMGSARVSGVGSKALKRMRAASVGLRQQDSPQDLSPKPPAPARVDPVLCVRVPAVLGGLPGKKAGERAPFAERMRRTLRDSRDGLAH